MGLFSHFIYFALTLVSFVPNVLFLMFNLAIKKLDGVAPLMTDPPPISSTTLSKKEEKKERKNDT